MSVLNAYYDTRFSPVSPDFAHFLACAEAHRRLKGLQGLALRIVAPSFDTVLPQDVSIAEDEHVWRLNRLLLPMTAFLPSIVVTDVRRVPPRTLDVPLFPSSYPPRTDEDRRDASLPTVAHAMRYHGAGVDVQSFRATERARALVADMVRGRRYYTIILRTASSGDAEISNRDEWAKVYRSLTARGHAVFVILDSADPTSREAAYGIDWTVAHAATDDLDIRLALCEQAADNLGIIGGFATVLGYSKAAFKVFRVVADGVSQGNAPEFFQHHQRWMRAADTAENILASISA
jgi:hypothetical protein